MTDGFHEFAVPAWILPAIIGALLLIVGVIVCAVIRKRRDVMRWQSRLLRVAKSCGALMCAALIAAGVANLRYVLIWTYPDDFGLATGAGVVDLWWGSRFSWKGGELLITDAETWQFWPPLSTDQGPTVRSPIWFLLLISGIARIILWRLDRRPLPGQCPCGYDLTGEGAGVVDLWWGSRFSWKGGELLITDAETWQFWPPLSTDQGPTVRSPIWFLLLISGIARIILWRLDRRPLPGQCPCGYDLTGNESGTCPECGRRADAVDESGLRSDCTADPD